MDKFKLKLRQRNIPEKDILEDLKRVAEHLAISGVTKELYDQHGHFGATTVIRKFGSWNSALSAAELVPINRQNIPNEELFQNLAVIWQSLGRQPTGKDISKSAGTSKFSLGTYEKRFGTWNKTLTAFIKYIENSPNTDECEYKNASKIKESSRTSRKINWRLRASILIRDNCICRMCGTSPSKDSTVTLHVDHIKAWTNGGETLPENLQTLCSVCNIGKSNLI